MVRAADTSIEVARLQRRVLSSKSIEERAAMVVEMSAFIRELTIEGIRRRNPEVGDRELMLELVERMHGRSLARAAEPAISARYGD